MGTTTAIAWTDHTFSPWWGCTRVSAACDHCYAETFAKRVGDDVWGKDAPRRAIGDKTWNTPLRWARDARATGARRRVFCASMADVFEDHDGPMVDHKGNPLPGRSVAAERQRLWDLIEETKDALDWLLLTKRPQNVMRMCDETWREIAWPDAVWVGTTVETQAYANIRVPQLLEVPAAVRFLSMEPLLEPVNLSRWLGIEWMDALGPFPDDEVVPHRWHEEGGWGQEMFAALRGSRPALDWLIVGGESGAGARPFLEGWALDVVHQARAAGAAPFVKQMGEVWSKEHGHGRTHGADPELWPAVLRRQEFPTPKPRRKG